MVDPARRGFCPLVNSVAALLIMGLIPVLATSTGEMLRAQAPTKEEAPPPAVQPQAPLQAPTKEDTPPPPPPSSVQPAVQVFQPGPPRFEFKIAPNTPLKDLLPVAPKAQKHTGRRVAADLASVPEVAFQNRLAKNTATIDALKQTAHTIAKINHLNGKKTDQFMEALRQQRPDLNGLPFVLGGDCRTKGDRSAEFAHAVDLVRLALQRQTMQPAQAAPAPPAFPPPPLAAPGSFPPSSPAALESRAVMLLEDATTAKSFWEQYKFTCAQDDYRLSGVDRVKREHVTQARIAALMQMLAPEEPGTRLGLVHYLAGVSHADATRALARLAIFSAEEEIRREAVEALKVRRERDYTSILVQGLRYPWPSVARSAADAIVRLERTDLLPELVGMLDEPDPRAPRVQVVNQKPVPVVRELVRINHHRNCLLCHAPGTSDNVSPESLTAAVPIPGTRLPSPSEYYRDGTPDALVRVDVTYLRQDFSAYQSVPDEGPWPEMQRFDFLVRTRTLTEAEAGAFRNELASSDPSQPSPYHRAALAALREMTGREAGPTAEAWRQVLKQRADNGP